MVQLERVMPSPGCMARTTNCVVELVALAKATTLAACRSQPTHLPVLVDGLGDPLGVRVSSDSFVEWINEDHLKKLVCRIFTNPVSVQDSQSPTVTPRSFLSHRLQAPCKLELVNTMMDGLAVGRTLRHRALAATAAHTNPVDDITLLGLVAQPACLVGLRGLGRPVQCRRAGGTASSGPAAGSASGPSNCFFLHSSWMYL